MEYEIIVKKNDLIYTLKIFNQEFLNIAHGRCLDPNSIVLCAGYAVLDYFEKCKGIKYCGITKSGKEELLFWKNNFKEYDEINFRIMDII